MKYIIDIDALKECLDLLPTSYSDIGYVELEDVYKMIDRFPKEEYVENAKVYREIFNDVNKDILDGRGLKPLND